MLNQYVCVERMNEFSCIMEEKKLICVTPSLFLSKEIKACLGVLRTLYLALCF